MAGVGARIYQDIIVHRGTQIHTVMWKFIRFHTTLKRGRRLIGTFALKCNCDTKHQAASLELSTVRARKVFSNETQESVICLQ